MTVTVEWVTNNITSQEEGGDTIDIVYGIIDIDLIGVETYNLGAEITQHPVEEGIDITDHVRPSLSMVSLEMRISNTPIRSTRGHRAQMEDIDLRLPPITSITRGARRSERSETEESDQRQGVRVLRFGEEFDRCQEVFDQLVELKDSGTPIAIIGARFGDLDGYLIASLSVPVEMDNGINILMDIQELRTARTETVDAPSPRVERGRNRANRGSQSSEDAEDPSEEVSTLLALTDEASRADLLRRGLSFLGIGGS